MLVICLVSYLTWNYFYNCKRVQGWLHRLIYIISSSRLGATIVNEGGDVWITKFTNELYMDKHLIEITNVGNKQTVINPKTTMEDIFVISKCFRKFDIYRKISGFLLPVCSFGVFKIHFQFTADKFIFNFKLKLLHKVPAELYGCF